MLMRVRTKPFSICMVAYQMMLQQGGVLEFIKNFIVEMWSQFKENKFIKTHIYNRLLYEKNLDNLNPQKLFNYYIQAYETERNVKLLNKLHQYLLTRETNIIAL